ncbi:MAG: hypothetical protein KDK39_02250, partial [Leptospiraceae bacterium]|nr:hypothetical protein [Leptospiraceae bacterium]
MSFAAQLLSLFYRHQLPIVPVCSRFDPAHPADGRLLGWLLQSKLVAAMSDLEAADQLGPEIPPALLSQQAAPHLLERLLQKKEIPVLNLAAQNLGSADASQVRQWMRESARLPLASAEARAATDRPSVYSNRGGVANRDSGKSWLSALALQNLPWPLFATDMAGVPLFFNRHFEEHILPHPVLGNSIDAARSYFRELLVNLLADTIATQARGEWTCYDAPLNMEIRICALQEQDQIKAYLYTFQAAHQSSAMQSWYQRLQLEGNLDAVLEDFEGRLIAHALLEHDLNISHTARALNCKRTTLQHRITRLDLENRFAELQSDQPVPRRRRSRREMEAARLSAAEKGPQGESAASRPVASSGSQKKTAKKTRRSAQQKPVKSGGPSLKKTAVRSV